MPEMLEALAYDNLTAEEKKAIQNPTSFAGPAEAISWAMDNWALVPSRSSRMRLTPRTPTS